MEFLSGRGGGGKCPTPGGGECLGGECPYTARSCVTNVHHEKRQNINEFSWDIYMENIVIFLNEAHNCSTRQGQRHSHHRQFKFYDWKTKDVLPNHHEKHWTIYKSL